MSQSTGGFEPTRRELLAAFTAIGVGAIALPTDAQAMEATVAMQTAKTEAAATGGAVALKVLTQHELATMKMLLDYLYPKDTHGGPASAAGCAEWIDIMLDIDPAMQQGHRGGLAWIDHEAGKRFGVKAYVDASDAQRRQILDDIAWPAKSTPELAAAIRWFTSLRDIGATAYWSSEMGFKDLGYLGNVPNPDWNGCPPVAYTRLGVTKP